MKKLLFIVLSLITSVLYAVPLPEGTDARITSVKQEGGKIVYVRLSEKTTVNTPVGPITVSDDLRFNQDGQVIECKPSLSGEIETPIGKLKYDSNRPLYFYDSGCVKQIYIYPSQEITIAAGTFNISSGWLLLYENYVPFRFDLARNADLTLPSGTIRVSTNTMTFNADGTINSFYVSETAPLQTSIGKVYPRRYSLLSLYPDASIKSIVSEDICMVTVADSLIFTSAGTEITFNQEGKVNRFVTDAEELNLNGFELKFNDSYKKYVYVHEDNSFVLMPYTSEYSSRSLYFSIAKQKFYEPYGVYFPSNFNVFYMWKGGSNGMEAEMYCLDIEGEPVAVYSVPVRIPRYSYHDYQTESYLNLFHNKPLVLDEEASIIAYLKEDLQFNEIKDYSEFVYTLEPVEDK